MDGPCLSTLWGSCEHVFQRTLKRSFTSTPQLCYCLWRHLYHKKTSFLPLKFPKTYYKNKALSQLWISQSALIPSEQSASTIYSKKHRTVLAAVFTSAAIHNHLTFLKPPPCQSSKEFFFWIQYTILPIMTEWPKPAFEQCQNRQRRFFFSTIILISCLNKWDRLLKNGTIFF